MSLKIPTIFTHTYACILTFFNHSLDIRFNPKFRCFQTVHISIILHFFIIFKREKEFLWNRKTLKKKALKFYCNSLNSSVNCQRSNSWEFDPIYQHSSFYYQIILHSMSHAKRFPQQYANFSCEMCNKDVIILWFHWKFENSKCIQTAEYVNNSYK